MRGTNLANANVRACTMWRGCTLYDDKIRYVECCCTLLLLMVYVKITLRVQIFSAISLAYIYIYTYTRSEWPLFNNDFDSIIESCLSDAHCILCTSYCILMAPGIYIDSLHFELLLVPGVSLPSSRSRPLHCAMAPNCCLFCEWAQQIAGQINCVFPMHFAFYIFHT